MMSVNQGIGTSVPGFELIYCNSGNLIHISQFSWCKFSHPVKKLWYQSIIQFLIRKQRKKTYSAVVKNNFKILCKEMRWVVKLLWNWPTCIVQWNTNLIFCFVNLNLLSYNTLHGQLSFSKTGVMTKKTGSEILL